MPTRANITCHCYLVLGQHGPTCRRTLYSTELYGCKAKCYAWARQLKWANMSMSPWGYLKPRVAEVSFNNMPLSPNTLIKSAHKHSQPPPNTRQSSQNNPQSTYTPTHKPTNSAHKHSQSAPNGAGSWLMMWVCLINDWWPYLGSWQPKFELQLVPNWDWKFPFLGFSPLVP